jgi:predicted nucleotidyltransferase
MDRTINKNIDNYISNVRKKYPELEKVYLFGSYAKNSYDENSDIDLAIIYKNLEVEEKFDLQVELMLLASEIDSRIEPHPFSIKEMSEPTPFINEILRYGKIIS